MCPEFQEHCQILSNTFSFSVVEDGLSFIVYLFIFIYERFVKTRMLFNTRSAGSGGGSTLWIHSFTSTFEIEPPDEQHA